jgi:predicted RNA methylase
VSEKLGNRRVTGTEQYYTPHDLALELTESLLERIESPLDRSFLEPAGGTGSFLNALKALGITKYEAVDLHPKHEEVKKQNFLDFKTTKRNLITISNPPFGRNNALSIPFFNHAAEFSDVIAFLVPRSWRKWSVQNRLDQNFHLIHDQDVDVDYVREDGSPFGEKNELRTCFQIWERRDSKRGKVKIQNQDLIAKSSPEDADFAIRVFGYGCGKILKNFPKEKNTTLMFLRVLDKRVWDHIEGLDYERFSNNTAFTKALSFPEINFLLNEQIFGDAFLELES